MKPEVLINSKIIEDLGWTILHSLWQIALIAFVLFALLKIFEKSRASFRYLISVSALAIAFVLPAATFVQLSNAPSASFSQSERSRADYAGSLNKNFPRPEDYPAFGAGANQTAQAVDKNASAIETVRNYFVENFSGRLSFVVFFWFAGVLFFAFRLLGGAWQLHVYRTREISAPSDQWQTKFAGLCEKLEIRKTVEFLQSNLIETPVVVGWLKPMILVPASVFLQINPKELETIIAHELVHIRRYDAFVNFVQSVVEILFFYHPCAWWISAVIRREREFATDEAVIKILENSRITYASALANLEEIRQRTNQKLPSLATAANGGNLMQRIQKILQKNTEIKRSASTAWSASLALALISAVLLTIFSPVQTSFVNAQAKTKNKKIAVGFVSIPPLDRTANPPKDSDATMRLLIEKLKSHDVPAIGFLQGGMISDGDRLYPVRANVVRLWRDAGLEIGTGSYQHVWFYDTPYDEYVAGVEKNEAIARKILAEKNLPLRYFSYPYLNTGRNAEDRARFEAWLNQRGITPMKYTIDNQEWMYSFAYDAARNDNDISTMTEIRVEFIKYMSAMFDHFEAYSQEMFGRDIAQTMVLTPSRLVSDSADELFGMIERRGYKFVPVDEALSDEAYKTDERFAETQNRINKSGISWFERWRMAQGGTLRDEPKVSALVYEMWQERGKKAPVKPPPPPPEPSAPPAPPKPKI